MAEVNKCGNCGHFDREQVVPGVGAGTKFPILIGYDLTTKEVSSCRICVHDISVHNPKVGFASNYGCIMWEKPFGHGG